MNKLHVTLFFFVIGIFGCQSPKPSEPIDLMELTIEDIHQAYEKGIYTSQQLVEAYLNRIEQLDEKTNALTIINPKAVLIAKELDEEYQKTKVLRPLHGIPLIVKDNFNTKNIPTTGGSLALRDFVPDEDAFIIQKLVNAGVIIIAKSNMAEWALTPWGSFSSTHGATLNPYNLAYSPGGSSGGTGASISANFGTVGLGTDTGNSIRGPSSHNSLVGFRPTMGLVSRSGIIPLHLTLDMAGPMCRTVEDATRVLEIITGNDPDEPLTKYSEGKFPDNYVQFLQEDGLKGARIGILRNISEAGPDPEILGLFENAIEDMKLMGAQMVDSVNIPNFLNLKRNLFCQDFRSDLETYLATYVKNDTLQTIEDIIRVGTKSAFTAEQIDILANNPRNVDNHKMACLDVYSDQGRIDYRIAIEDFMDKMNFDALIYPSWNVKPYKMDSMVEEYVGFNSLVIAPFTGQPAFTVPMGLMEGNLPTGIEFLGRMYSEPTLIKLAYAYEQGTNHRKPPNLKE